MHELPVFLLPGVDGYPRYRAEFCEALALANPVTVIEPPDKTISSYDDLISHYQSKLPKGPIGLIGESMSGPAAVAIAANCLRDVRSVGLVATFLKPPAPAALLWLASMGRPGFLPHDLTRPILAGSGFDPDLFAMMMRDIGRIASPILASRIRCLASCGAEAAYRSLTIPVFWLHGRRDRLVPFNRARNQSAVIKAARFQDINSGHFVLQDQPQQAAAFIRQFLAEMN